MTLPQDHVREVGGRPLWQPTDAEFQAAFAIISDEWNRQWEAARPAREAAARSRAADWIAHAEGCDRRAKEYDEMGMPDKATDQRNKAAFARGMAEELTNADL